MKHDKLKIVIIGKGEMLANLIRGAVLAGVEISGVFRYERLYSNPIKVYFNDCLHGSAVNTLIKKYNLYDMRFKSVNSKEFKKELLRLGIDILLVGTWSEKLDPEVTNIPRLAAINAHPSLLPKYRGPNPYLESIRHGERYSGITFHLVNDKFDAGAILAQDRVPISEGDTGKELRNKTVLKARLLLVEILSALKEGMIIPTPQNEDFASYYPEIKPEEMTLDFNNETSKQILLHVRAFHPFRSTYIQLEDDFFVVNPYKVMLSDKKGEPYQIVEKNRNSLTISCADNISVRFDGLKKWNKCIYSLFMIKSKYRREEE